MIMAAFSICFGSSASTMSTTSKRPKVAKLSFHFMPGHSLLILVDTSAANFLNSLGSRNASGENRLRITYVAMWHLLADPVAYPVALAQITLRRFALAAIPPAVKNRCAKKPRPIERELRYPNQRPQALGWPS